MLFLTAEGAEERGGILFTGIPPLSAELAQRTLGLGVVPDSVRL